MGAAEGLFITIEGPNGCGKTTFTGFLKESLEKAGKKVFLTKEPSETPFGGYVRRNEGSLRGEPYAYLIAADRCYHLETIVCPKLLGYDFVLCDRYIESSLVLQSFDGVSDEIIWRLNGPFRIPDLSIILTASPDVLGGRLSKRGELTTFEKRMTREEEAQRYLDVSEKIAERGFKTLLMRNETESDLKKNIEKSAEQINILFVEKRNRHEEN